MGNPTQLNS